MSGDHVRTESVAMPLSLTDFVKAFRELLGAFRDATGIVRDGMDLLRRRNARVAAGDLDGIAFPPGGFCHSLAIIGTGKGTAAQFDELARILNATAEDVAERIDGLRKYRDTVREQCGAAVAARLLNLLDGPDGKFVIRYEIEGLIDMGRRGKPNTQEQAIRILGMISEFNDKLIELHDVILPPRGAAY